MHRACRPAPPSGRLSGWARIHGGTARMIKCSYCGGENEDGAIQCQKCGLGLDELQAEVLPGVEDQPRQTGLRLALRLLAALGVGAAVAGISLYTAWHDTFDSEGARREQARTQYHLE